MSTVDRPADSGMPRDREGGGPGPGPGSGGGPGPIPDIGPGRGPGPGPGLGDGDGTETLLFPNPFGGFSADGSEYVIRLRWLDGEGHLLPPRPWVNVVANERAGFLVSERGAGFTWSGNSREHRLTPWSNDTVTDPHDEALYLRDDESGRIWSPLPGPAPLPAGYEVRHGFGSSRFTVAGEGLVHETALFVPPEDPVKVVRLRLRNPGSRPRRLTAVWYARLVLGVLPEETAASVQIETGPGVVRARNPEERGYEEAVAFVAAPGGDVLATDRGSFLGAAGEMARPEALRRGDVGSDPDDGGNREDGGDRDDGSESGGGGGGSDGDDRRRSSGRGRAGGATTGAARPSGEPCAALAVRLEIAAGGEVEVHFLLGEGESRAHADALVARYASREAVDGAFAAARRFWRDALGRVRVETPDPAFDVMMNGWLLYQVLACRLWARSAFYQSGGAFGFRDQLQDAAAWVWHDPARTRAQILLHAAHQFVEGDVLHWWHPPLSMGIRTRFADDLLWLPLVTAFYAGVTGDRAVLDETVRFLRARALTPGEDEAFLVPEESGTEASLYEHCCRAIDRSLTSGPGAHGLPLFGTGDWNDGMNRVGREGRGESVWMAFFLIAVLDGFGPICEERGEGERARRYAEAREALRAAANEGGWDGAWYRRGYYDDGAPLGTAGGDECRIDALVQAWSVLAKAAPAGRARQALDAVDRYLVDPAGKIVRLLDPPFESTPHDPGYIKGYAPGVRENGGQYTHAALWVVRAFAEQGRRDRAVELLRWINPVHRTRTAEEIAVYQLEPYVVSADIYGVPPHLGRGGWSWYTGSAGWMYRVGIETILGVQMEEGRRIRLRPRIPDGWSGFTVRMAIGGRQAVAGLQAPDVDGGATADGTVLEISVRNPHGAAERVVTALLDGAVVAIEDGAAVLELPSPAGVHRAEVTLGAANRRGEP